MKALVKILMLLAAATGALLITGCAGPKLSDVAGFGDDQVAYLVNGALGRTSQQGESARRLSERTLIEIQASRPAATVQDLTAWRDYETLLNNPVKVDPESYKGAPELSKITKLEALASYISSNPDKLSIIGADMSELWRSELAVVQKNIADLEKQLSDLDLKAEAAAKRGAYKEAFTLAIQSLKMTPKDDARKARLNQYAGKYTDQVAAKLQELLGKARQLAESKFKGADSSPQMVAQVEQALGGIYQELLDFKAMTTAEALFVIPAEAAKKMDSLYTGVYDITGACWLERLRLFAKDKQFWQAYLYVVQKLPEAKDSPKYKDSPLATRLGQAYAEMLPEAGQYYLTLANEYFYKDRYGLSAVLCRMVLEMSDYASFKQIQIPAAAATAEQNARRTLVDCGKSIESLITRNLLITDFLPAVTEESENLALQIRTRCQRYADVGNGLCWGVKVPQGKTLAADRTAALPAGDLMIVGNMQKKIAVDLLPPEELGRGFVSVGVDNLTEIPNPLYDLKKGELRTAFQQEVHLYPWTKKLLRKRARVALTLTCEQAGKPPTDLLKVDAVYPNTDLSLKDLVTESEELDYNGLVLGIPRIWKTPNEVKMDTPPAGQPNKLSPDDLIKNAVILHVIDRTLASLDNLLLQYPVSELAARAVDAEKDGQQAEAAEYWGQFIEYIAFLSQKDFGKETRWLMNRQVLLKNVQGWSSTRWKTQDPAHLALLPDFWKRGTEAAAKALAK